MARKRLKQLLAAAATGCGVLALQLLLARIAATPPGTGGGFSSLTRGGLAAAPSPPPPPEPTLSGGGDVHPGFAVFTDSCKIPDFDPWDASVLPHVRLGEPIRCDSGGSGGDGDLTFVSSDGLLGINAAAARRVNLSYCVYKEVLRVDGTDDEYDYSTDVVRFVEPTRLDKEFVKVTCYNAREERLPYCNFYARVQPLPSPPPPPLQPRPPSVLLIGLDSVSRLNFARQFPETRRLLMEDLGAVELRGYTKVADNTFVNLMPLFVGLFADEAGWSEARAGEPFDDQPLAWRLFAERARYRTLFAEDAPEIAIWNYPPKRGFRRPPADHYYRPLALAMERDGCAVAARMWSASAAAPGTSAQSQPSSERDCFGARAETAAVLDYVEQFVRSYGRRGEPTFAFAFLTRVTHSDVNKRSDAEHARFLRRLVDTGLLTRYRDGDSNDDNGGNEALVIYFSDHGARYGPIVGTYVGKLEERMPALFVVPPRSWLRDRRPRAEQNLMLNARRLSTPFDVYATLMDLLAAVVSYNRAGGGDGDRPTPSPRRGVSLFDAIPESRTCTEAGVLPHWCTCQLPAPAAKGDEQLVREAANAVVRHLNAQLQKAEPAPPYTLQNLRQPLCADLRLESVVDALLARSADEVLRFRASVNDVLDRRVYFGERARGVRSTLTVTVRAEPGGGLFAATVSHNEESGTLDVLGEVTRLNAYGEQSACVRQHALKKICYCFDNVAAVRSNAQRRR